MIKDIAVDQASQALCLLASLFIPYECKIAFSPTFKKAIKGCYLNLDTLINLYHSEKNYYLPSKTEWGMDASENETWAKFENVVEHIDASMKQNRSVLCWQQHKGSYLAFFIVWW